MVIDIILVIVLLLGLVGLIVLAIGKFPILKLIDVDNLSGLKQQEVKQDLVEARLQRKLQRGKRWLKKQFDPWYKKIQFKQDQLKQSVQQMEEKVAQQEVSLGKVEEVVAKILNKAEQAKQEGDLAEAENLYLSAIQHQPTNLDIYQSLADVYLETRDYEQAKEVLEYLAEQGRARYSSLGLAKVAQGQGFLEEAKGQYLKSLALKNTIQLHLELAYVYQQLGDFNQALAHLTEARELEPNSPKVLDFYIELSIVNGHLNEAQEALDVLREVNSDNQKINDFTEQIRAQVQKNKPIKRRSSKKITSFGVKID
ncbi:tetratricopeptide repeat protein [Patescibacteria group bacterium]|nr:tetratricopeptide repeat protein [Patescibacteria group bacterium]